MSRPEISIIVPTLDEAGHLAGTLDRLCALADAGIAFETVVADGGSRDGTQAIARDAGAKLIECGAGRGTQLAAGAAAARGSWLLFLHADTCIC